MGRTLQGGLRDPGPSPFLEPACLQGIRCLLFHKSVFHALHGKSYKRYNYIKDINDGELYVDNMKTISQRSKLCP